MACRRPVYVLGMLTAAASLAGSAGAQPLPTDPGLIQGQLDNGLRYMVVRHVNPTSRAVVWLHMHTGSLNETERQRGIAHYLEHMAFNGSENFKPGTLVPFFQSLGMTFGRDQNAFTNFDQTTFQLTLPDTQPETLAKGMTFFADVVWRESLLPTEIDAERQIILEERRRGLSGRQRTNDYVMAHMTPGSLFGVREPIGLEETIKGVGPADFKDYYGRWYCASNATLMVVADEDPQQVVKVIHAQFDSAPKKPRPAPQDLKVAAYDKPFAIVATDPEVRTESVRVVHLEPARPPVTTLPQYRGEMAAIIGEEILNRRFGDRQAGGQTSYANAGVRRGNEAEAIFTAELTASAKPGKWKQALEESALELQRARAFGFTARELADVKRELISNGEQAVETEPTTTNQAVMQRLNASVTTGEPLMSPKQRLDLVKEVLSTMTLDEVNKRFAAEFEFKTVAFVAVMPAGPDAPSESQLLDIGVKALAATPTREAETAHATTLMEKPPTPGTVADGSVHDATKVWSGWLSNNVRVHYRFMNDRKNEVSVHVSLLGGELLETADNRGITQAAQLAWSRPATRHLSSTDIRELMTGKKVSVRGGGGFGGFGGGRRGGGGGGGGGGDAINLTIAGNPEDLETGFQLAYLMLTEPKIEPASLTQSQTMMRQRLQEMMSSPMGLGARTAGSLPYPDDEPRTTPLTADQFDRITPDAAQAWLDKLIKQSPIEVVIVGDLPQDKALDLAAKYLGALPSRDRVAPGAFASLRHLSRPKGPRIVEKTIDTPTDQAFVFSGFYGADEGNRADTRALSMAARVLSTRMIKDVREDAQLVYSIGAGSRAATTYPGFGVFSAAAPTDPSKVPALVAKLSEMYAAFAKDGPTQEELDVAKKQFAKTYEDELKDPGFWSTRLQQLTFRGVTLDQLAEEPAAIQALTAEQVKATFAKYYSPENAIVVSVKPSGKRAEKEKAEKVPAGE